MKLVKRILITLATTSLLVSNVYAVKEVRLENKIGSLYISFFNRAPDYAGLSYWNTTGTNVVNAGGTALETLKQLSAGFAGHPTFTSTYNSMDDETFVNAIYNNALGRDGDEGGINYWKGLLSSGKSRSDMVAEFMEISLTADLDNDPQYASLSAADKAAAQERQDLITNKAEVAVYFTKNLGSRTNLDSSTNAMDPDSLANDAAYLASQKVIANVGLDASSVQIAIGKLFTLINDEDAINSINVNWNLIDFTIVAPHNSSFTSTHFSGSQNCAQCHDGIVDGSGNDVSIVNAWKSTMMANSTRDPLWKAKVASELKRNPTLESVINDKCTRCHAPMANYEAHTVADTVKVFDDGFLNTSNAHHDQAMDGVSCTLCHQVSDTTDLGTLSGFSGKYTINKDRIIYGQYDQVVTGPMKNDVNYTPTYSAHIHQSKMCATCHNLKTPFVDADGNLASTSNPASEFPEQMPYTEWEYSDFNTTQSCQDCHMAKTNGVKIASKPPWLDTKRDQFSKHTFVGGNKFMLDILNNNKVALGIDSTVSFDNILTKTDELLKSAATITLTKQSSQANSLSIEVTINSTTGHKLPTSFPSRRVFIHFSVFDVNNNLLFESGKVNADGSIVGSDADQNTKSYEPHYDVITSADQVQIYEAVMQNTDNQVTYTLLRAASYVKDNRLVPKGFNKQTVPNDIAVKGNAVSDENFIGGSDNVTYIVDTSKFTVSPSRVEVRLLYQTISFPFAQDLFTDQTNESTSFKVMYDTSNLKTSSIASQTLDL